MVVTLETVEYGRNWDRIRSEWNTREDQREFGRIDTPEFTERE